MRLGMHIRELSQRKVGVAIALVVALLAATRMLYGISLFPPSLDRQSVDVATASTHVLVDTPRSMMIDLRQDIYQLRALSERAVLLGNVMASPPVREYIARRADLEADQIKASAPLTPEQPRPVADTENETHTSDILKRPDEYRLNIQVNPTVPVLDVYSQAPDADSAKKLANAAVDGLRDYLDTVAAQRGTAADSQVTLEQLGKARGEVINSGAGITIALIVFALVFAGSCAAVLAIARIRRGWSASEGFEGPPARGVT